MGTDGAPRGSDGLSFGERQGRWPQALLLLLFLPLLLLACGEGAEEEAPQEEGAEDSGQVTHRIEGAGFRAPESVFHDEADDIYLVSNVNGDPAGEEDNGFISRVTPDGEVEELKWIDGEAGDFTLNAPKGMMILGDSLYVADVDCVRVFVRPTGDHSHDICFSDATFLNDLTVDENNIFYVTDSGSEDEPGALFRFSVDGGQALLVEGEHLGGPNGIAFTPRGFIVATFETGALVRMTAEGEQTPMTPQSERQLDGIVFREDESFFFSSWGDSAVYAVGGDGSVSQAVSGVPSPADMGYDRERNRLLVPLLQENTVLFVEVDPPGSTSS